MSHKVVDGIPYINGKPARPCEDRDCAACRLLAGAIQPWLCPECGGHLGSSMICLNACHLTEEQRERFAKLLKCAK